jgi:hypothetical protein
MSARPDVGPRRGKHVAFGLVPPQVIWVASLSILHALGLQIMKGHCQLSEGPRLDGIFSVPKTSYCTLGEPGPAREKLGRKLFCFRSDFIQIFRVDYSFVLGGWHTFASFAKVGTRKQAGGPDNRA